MANLFAKKSIAAMTAEANEKGSETLERVLGPVQLTMLGIGAVIGAGIFVLSGLGAQTAGPVDCGTLITPRKSSGHMAKRPGSSNRSPILEGTPALASSCRNFR